MSSAPFKNTFHTAVSDGHTSLQGKCVFIRGGPETSQNNNWGKRGTQIPGTTHTFCYVLPNQICSKDRVTAGGSLM